MICKQKQPTRNNPCRLSYYLLDFDFLPHINEISVLDTVVLDKLRNSSLVAPCDARERVSTLHSVRYCLLGVACRQLCGRAGGLLETIQPCRLYLSRIVYIAYIHINIAADTADSSSGAVLPHTISATIVAA